jgi:hypothetical protein
MRAVAITHYVAACGLVAALIACDSSMYSSTASTADATTTKNVEADATLSTDANASRDAELANDTNAASDAGTLCDSGWLEGRVAVNLRTQSNRRDWLNPSNALRLDALVALVPSMLAGNESHYLNVVDFGFDVPTQARITGIETEVTRKSSRGGKIRDFAVRLYAAGYSNANRGNLNQVWTDQTTTIVYGGSSDLWDSSWTPQQINSVTFGIAFAVDVAAQTPGYDTVYVDRIRARVSWICP